MGRELSDGAAITASIEAPAEFAVVFHRHYDLVHGYIRKRVGDSLADDLASQTFLVAFDRRGSYDGTRANARPWLLGIATNLIHGKRRQERRQLRAYGRAGADLDVNPLEGIEARADAQRLRPRLAAVLASLPGDEVDPLLLFAWAELSYEEIAEALDLPIGTVKSRLSRARRRVRELLPPAAQASPHELIPNLEVDHG
jgi:RNA polymerase sigma-70 factor (ECF subfamily)